RTVRKRESPSSSSGWPDLPDVAQSPLLLGSGQIDRLGNRCVSGTDRGAKSVHEGSRVLLQDLTVDICGRVTGTVIARVVCATSLAAEQLGLIFWLPPGCAGIEPHGRNALLGE